MISENVGIYGIISPSGKIYVGMTNDSFSSRLHGHFKKLKSGHHHSSGLQRAYLKHGPEKLIFKVFEEYSPGSISEETLLQREQFWWDKLRHRGVSLYNGRPTGTGSVSHTDESRSRLREAVRMKNVEAVSWDSKGHPLYLKTCEVCKNDFVGRKKLKMCSKSCRIKNSQKVVELFSYEEIYDLYWNQNLSRSKIAKKLNVGQTTVLKIMEHLGVPRRTNSQAQKLTKSNSQRQYRKVSCDKCDRLVGVNVLKSHVSSCKGVEFSGR